MKMTKNTQKQGGKYNAEKEWKDEGATGQAFVSADESLAYVKKPNTVILDKMEQPLANSEAEVEPQAVGETASDNDSEASPLSEPAADPWKKVDWKKRHDDLKRHHDRKINAMKEEIAQVKEEMRANRPTYTPPKSAEDLAAFKAENPDVYAVVESVAHLRATEESKNLSEELDGLKERLKVAEAERAYAELKTLVPDFEEIRQDEEFHTWAEAQPQQIQDWVYRNRTDVQLAAKAINLYKADRGKLPQQQAQTPPATERPTERGADEAVPTHTRREEPTATTDKLWKRSEIGALSPAQFEKLQPEIDRAFAEGRIDMEA